MGRYLSLKCDLPPELEDGLLVVLDQFPVLGSSIEESDGCITAVIYMEVNLEEEAGRLTRSLTGLGIDNIVAETFEDEDWLAAYRRTTHPFAVGRKWWIDPGAGGSTRAPANRVRLAIEPSIAFGSGSHESTQLMLEGLEDLPVAGASVLDVGTGSGILALAADALGARTVVALDVDPVAVFTARRTARHQAWSSRPVFLVSPITGLGAFRFDLILCNMISSKFVPLISDLVRLLVADGQLVLSGALGEERATVRAVVEHAGLRVLQERRLGDWMSLRVGHA